MRLQQVLINFQSNALKFTPQNGTVKVLCRNLPNSSRFGTIEISVIDTGIGIKPEDIGKLFKMFGFLDATAAVNTKGVGLGLYISKLITNKFGGNATVTSEVNKGSTFTFTFTLEEQNENRRVI